MQDNMEDEEKIILDDDDEDEDELLEQKDTTKKKKTKTTDYSKIATALNDMMSKGIKIVPPDINKSKYDFRPDAKNNQIIYGLKAIHGISEDVINSLIKHQPFENIQDMLNKVKLNRTQIIALIKAGTFDNITTVSKREMLYNYISSISDLKDNLTLSNVPMLVKNNLLTEEYLINPLEKYNFNKQLRAKQAKKDKKILVMDKDDIEYYKQCWDEDILVTEDGTTYILEKNWKKIYDKEMDVVRDFINSNKENLLRHINNNSIKENLLKYAQGSESSWEMDILCFYYSGHELEKVDENLYNIVDFHDLEETPEVSLFTQWKGQAYPIYKLNTIMGTVIGKNKLRHTVALLTTKGKVVYIKFYGEMFSFFDKQISEKQDDGKKKVVEKSWFKRGNKLLITGIRKEEQFFPKSYRSTPIKQLYLINKVNSDGSLILQDHRYGYN